MTRGPLLAARAEMTTSGTGAEAATAAGPGQVVKVKRKLLVACMTCPICHKLLRDATTISECLHTCESTPAPLPFASTYLGFLSLGSFEVAVSGFLR